MESLKSGGSAHFTQVEVKSSLPAHCEIHLIFLNLAHQVCSGVESLKYSLPFFWAGRLISQFGINGRLISHSLESSQACQHFQMETDVSLDC